MTITGFIIQVIPWLLIPPEKSSHKLELATKKRCRSQYLAVRWLIFAINSGSARTGISLQFKHNPQSF